MRYDCVHRWRREEEEREEKERGEEEKEGEEREEEEREKEERDHVIHTMKAGRNIAVKFSFEVLLITY